MLFIFLCWSLFMVAADQEISIEMTTPIPENSGDTPLRDLCDDMIFYYFKGNGEKIRDQIKPYLERRLNSSWKRQKINRMQNIELKRLSSTIEPDIERYINKKVSQSMEEAFDEEHQTRMRYQTEAGERCSKNQVAVITAITGVITAAIAAGVTLAITFGS